MFDCGGVAFRKAKSWLLGNVIVVGDLAMFEAAFGGKGRATRPAAERGRQADEHTQ